MNDVKLKAVFYKFVNVGEKFNFSLAIPAWYYWEKTVLSFDEHFANAQCIDGEIAIVNDNDIVYIKD